MGEQRLHLTELLQQSVTLHPRLEDLRLRVLKLLLVATSIPANCSSIRARVSSQSARTFAGTASTSTILSSAARNRDSNADTSPCNTQETASASAAPSRPRPPKMIVNHATHPPSTPSRLPQERLNRRVRHPNRAAHLPLMAAQLAAMNPAANSALVNPKLRRNRRVDEVPAGRSGRGPGPAAPSRRRPKTRTE